MCVTVWVLRYKNKKNGDRGTIVFTATLSPLRRTVRYSNHAQPDLPQVTKLRRCGVGIVNSGHVLQAHGSDALVRLYTDVVYAWISAQAFLGCSNAREQTHRLTPVGRSPCKGDIPVLCKINTP